MCLYLSPLVLPLTFEQKPKSDMMFFFSHLNSEDFLKGLPHLSHILWSRLGAHPSDVPDVAGGGWCDWGGPWEGHGSLTVVDLRYGTVDVKVLRVTGPEWWHLGETVNLTQSHSPAQTQLWCLSYEQEAMAPVEMTPHELPKESSSLIYSYDNLKTHILSSTGQ